MPGCLCTLCFQFLMVMRLAYGQHCRELGLGTVPWVAGNVVTVTLMHRPQKTCNVRASSNFGAVFHVKLHLFCTLWLEPLHSHFRICMCASVLLQSMPCVPVYGEIGYEGQWQYCECQKTYARCWHEQACAYSVVQLKAGCSVVLPASSVAMRVWRVAAGCVCWKRSD